jgi:hypothetical protein
MFQNLLIKYSSRQQITYGINVHANTGEIPSNLGNTVKIVNELIESRKNNHDTTILIIAGCLAGIFLIVFYLLVGKILSQEKTILI